MPKSLTPPKLGIPFNGRKEAEFQIDSTSRGSSYRNPYCKFLLYYIYHLNISLSLSLHRPLGVQSLYICFSPPARWGLLDFMSDARLLLPSPSFSFLLLPSPSFFLLLTGPHLPSLDRSEPRQISSASSWSQWASPDFICQLLIAVVLAGSHLPALDSNGPRRTSTGESLSAVGLTGESLSAVGLAGPQPDRVWALWASPDLNRRGSSAVGLAGPQPARRGALSASPDLNRREQIELQKICQIECQIECKKICQIECQIDMLDRMSEDMPDRMSEDMPQRM